MTKKKKEEKNKKNLIKKISENVCKFYSNRILL